MFKKVDQVAIAVPSLEGIRNELESVWGFELSETETIDKQGVSLCFVKVGETRLEFMEPSAEGTPVGQFLRKRGPGIQHIAFEVDDLQKTIDELKLKGVEFINETPKLGAGGSKIAFVHPRSFFGILLELTESPS